MYICPKRNWVMCHPFTSSDQFGFKSKVGTDMCTYVLKETVDNYKCLNGSMFMGFLDASKAFDRIRHSTLFKKLIHRQVPSYIVRIMIYWYTNQTMVVRWSGIYLRDFKSLMVSGKVAYSHCTCLMYILMI